MQNNGYKVSETNFQHFNPGIDFIAEKKGSRYYVELTSEYDLVPRLAVSDAEREKHRYNCNKVILITKSFFDEEAIELSKSTG